MSRSTRSPAIADSTDSKVGPCFEALTMPRRCQRPGARPSLSGEGLPRGHAVRTAAASTHAYVDFLAAPGRRTASSRSGRPARGSCSRSTSGSGRRALHRGRSRPASGRGPRRRPDHGRHQLAAHAADRGADAVAVIGPPYFTYDEEALYRHFAAAAEASGCCPSTSTSSSAGRAGHRSRCRWSSGSATGCRPQGLEPAVRRG